VESFPVKISMNLQNEQKKCPKGWLSVLAASPTIFCILILIAGRSTLWDRDEPRYSSVAVEMVKTGNYLVPTLDGKPWPDKPPLMYWLMSIPVRLFGPTSLACRFWSVLGTVATCILTYIIGKKMFSEPASPKAGLLSMLILASSLLVLFVGTAAIADGIVLPFMVASMVIFINAMQSGFKITHILLLGITLSLGALAKGPIGLLPVLVMLIVILLSRKTNKDNLPMFLSVCSAAALGCLIFLLWAIPTNRQAGGNFLQVFFGKHVFGRAIRPMEHHGGNWLLFLPYYIPVIIVGFFPFILHLPGSLSAILGGRVGNKQAKVLLISWALSIFLLMSLAATKLPHYILFIWPALALMVAGTIETSRKGLLSERDKKWLRGGIWFFGPVAFVFAAACFAGPFILQAQTSLHIPSLNWSMPLCGLILVLMAAAAIRLQLKEQFLKSSKILLACLTAFLIPFLLGVLPGLEQIKIPPTIARIIREKTAPDLPVYAFKFNEPSLNFYVGRPIEQLADEQAIADWALQKQKGILVIPKNLLEEIRKKFPDLPIEQIGSKKGINYSKGTVLDVAVVVAKKKVELK
jgi:4-amino-4-deoxy-L-arabinose transferase-like glycosyltransferase